MKFAKGGGKKMLGKMGAKTSKPGTITVAQKGSGGKFASGGGKKMVGKGSAKPSRAGVVSC